MNTKKEFEGMKTGVLKKVFEYESKRKKTTVKLKDKSRGSMIKWLKANCDFYHCEECGLALNDKFEKRFKLKDCKCPGCGVEYEEWKKRKIP